MDDCISRVALDMAASATPGFFTVYVVTLVGVALVATPIVLWLYRRRVVKLMNIRASGAAGDGPDALADLSAVPAFAGTWVRHDPVRLEQAAADGTRRLAWVLGTAAAAYALGAGALLTFSPLRPDETGQALPLATAGHWRAVMAVADVALVASLCAPVVLIGLAHPAFARLYWRRVVPVFLLAMAVRVTLADTSGNAAGPFLGSMLFTSFSALLFYRAFGLRNARNVVPLVAVAWGVVMAGILLAAVVGETVQACVLKDHDGVLLNLVSLLLMLAVLASPLLMLWPAYRLLGRLSLAYEAKRFSEAQLQQGCWWLVLLVLTAVGIGGTERVVGPWLPALGGVALLVFAGYLLATRQLSAHAPPCPLLLLRVFSQDERGERLLDEAAFRWRFVGPIRMIGGPDLATLTLDPSELLMFLRGRIRDHFVTDEASLDARLRALDDWPDPDGRYRVDEFYCFDTIWQRAVLELLDRTAVVLLDLRGFNEGRGGTAWELALLARRGALGRTLCLVDVQTDQAAVARALAPTGLQWPLPQAQIVDAQAALDGHALFRALAARAGVAPPGVPNR
jgi:hypothetical protein